MESVKTTEIELLEAEVKDKLVSLNLAARLPSADAGTAHPADYHDGLEKRFLRSGVFRRNPVRIYSAVRLHRSRKFSLSPDGLAHLLTSLPTELAETLATNIREIVLLPELVLHSECLLTHVFVPDRSLLAFYLYPQRFQEAPAAAYPERFRPGQMTTGSGLLPALCRSLIANHRVRAADTDHDRLLKFLIPRDLTRPGEIEAMQDIHDHYRKFRLD